jgi:hypothetical protein
MMKNTQKTHSRTQRAPRKTTPGLMGAVACAAALPMTVVTVRADDAPPPPPSRTDLLANVDFANEYVTPRGMMVRNQGLTVQPLLLGFANIYKGDSFINSVTLDGGAWNDIGTKYVGTGAGTPGYNGKPSTPWTEIDPIAGFSIGFAKNFELDVTYTAFNEFIESIPFSQHLDTKLSFNDSPYLPMGGFGFHPYVEFWQELSSKATDADLPAELGLTPPASHGKYLEPGSSYYIQTGLDPTYSFKDGIKIETPVDVLLPNERFYGEFYDKASTVGIVSVGGKVTVPMNFMPQGYGHWSCHLGVKYMNFVDDNLYNLNTFNSPGKPTRDTTLVYAGVSVFF